MTLLEFLFAWAVRSAILVMAGGIMVFVAWLKAPSARLAAWTAILLGSIAIPLLTQWLPPVPVVVNQGSKLSLRQTKAPTPPERMNLSTDTETAPPQQAPFDWTRVVAGIYATGLLVLLIRLCAGIAMSLRIRGRSRPTGQSKEAIEIRESDELTSPVVLGILQPSIVIPNDWREWSAAKLNAVLEHERSHVRRSDPILQLLSAAHRALLWFSPFSWLLHRNIVRSAEEASDDSAVAAMGDRVFYAEVLLDFMRRGVHRENLVAVPMARYGRPDVRIKRILEGNSSGREVTRVGVAVILAIGISVACVLAVATPQGRAQAQTVPATKAPAPIPQQINGDLSALGSVTSLSTVRVKSRIEGLLKAVEFKEGELVKEGQLLARVESNQAPSMQGELMQIEMEITQDKVQMSQAEKSGDARMIAELKGKLTADQAAATRFAYRQGVINSQSQIRSPITGLAGLRLIDPGNVIHPDDAIVVVAELQPISVIFTVPEDKLPQIRQRLKAGVKLAVEAWNRDNTAKIATGFVSAIDNQIDITTGTAKLKAEFQNEDGALFPNQFVNVRLALR